MSDTDFSTDDIDKRHHSRRLILTICRCVEDTDVGALRWMSVEVCEPGAPS